MKYAKRLLHLKIDPPELREKSKVLGEYGKVWPGVQAAVVRKYAPKAYIARVRAALPEEIQRGVRYINFAEIGLSGPHLHLTEQSVINFYFKVNGEVTGFYEGEARVAHELVLDSGNDYYPIDEATITEVERFVAQDGDVWVMSTRQPHAVFYDGDTRSGVERYRNIGDSRRVVVQVYLDVPYERAAEVLA
jgi:hypothetical protein